jgi:hypothetical protein
MCQSRPIFQRLHRALVLFKEPRRYLPRSALGQAIDYALSNWPLLGVYLEDGKIETDNNLVENAVRSSALGKKNFAVLWQSQCRLAQCHSYIFIERCRYRSIDPRAYLRDVLTGLSLDDQLAGQTRNSRGLGENFTLHCKGNRT